MRQRLSRICNHYPWHVISKACLALCERRLGNDVAAIEMVASIDRAVREHSLSREMYTRYSNKIDHFTSMALGQK